jgi:putative SOS response-associated peptidase YedK
MCGRFTSSVRKDQLAERFEVNVPELRERFNVAPTQSVLGIRLGDEGNREATFLRWGLVPHWAKDASIGSKMINARAETLLEKPSYKGLLKSKRCLIPADGFYEWKREGKTKLPLHFALASGEPFAFAGLWSRWLDKGTGELLETCTVITTTPNTLVAPVHNRMPVILTLDAEKLWLDPEVDSQEAVTLLTPYAADLMRALEVSTRVNSVANDDPSLLEPDAQTAQAA